MKHQNVKLRTVATFPKNYVLENLAVRSDNSVLVTAPTHKELWYVPSSKDGQPVEPELLFTFPQLATGIVEVEPNVFYISVGDFYGENPTFIVSIWMPVSAVRQFIPTRFFTFLSKPAG